MNLYMKAQIGNYGSSEVVTLSLESKKKTDQIRYMHLIVKHVCIEIIRLNYANKSFFGYRTNMHITTMVNA